MSISDAAVEAGGLKVFFKSVGKATISFGKNFANKSQ